MSEFNLNTLGNLLKSGFMHVSADGQIVNYNDQVLSLLEIDKATLGTHQNYFSLFDRLVDQGDYGEVSNSPVETNSYDYLSKQALSLPSGGSMKLDCLFQVPSGNILRVQRQLFKDMSLLIAFNDHTEEVVREKTLKAAFEMGSSGFIHYCYVTHTIKYQSRYFENILTSAEKAKIEKAGLWSLVHPDDRDRVRSVWKNFESNPKPQKLYVRCLLEQQGLVWFKSFFNPQISASGSVIGVMTYFIDVTETLSIEGALRMSKKNLEKALQLKTEFISRISHEVRTPMNAMVGIADALIHHHNDPSITPKLQLIQDSSVNILRILDETLDYAKLEADEIKIDPTPSSPAEVVTRVCELWQELAQRRSVSLNYRIDSNVPKSLNFDSHRYEQCINNLVSNAIKFAEGGKVDVLLTKIQKAGSAAQLVLAVKDNGIGMTAEQEENLFKPFKQADSTISRRFGGTGLGMKITRDIIELMGGKISVKSSSGKGSVFMIALPLEPAQNLSVVKAPIQTSEPGEHSLTARAPEPRVRESLDLTARIMESVPIVKLPPVIEKPKGPYEHLRVLVVDDNATNHLVVQSLLDGMVGTIYVANDGQEALDVLAVEDVDVVFMDIHMPVMDGIEATLAIRNSDKPWSDVKIIALTADPLYQQKRLCMNIGMDYALAKPVKLADLEEALKVSQEVQATEIKIKKSA